MVKGNWERRAELVAARRVEERNRKLSKSAGSKQLATAESVITKVQRDPLFQKDGSTVEVWLLSDSDISVCREWLRTESCSTKRCKYLHDSTVGYLRKLQFFEDENNPTEVLPSGPFLLSSLPRKDYSRLQFLAVNGECIYDKSCPELWEAWIEQRNLFVKGLDRTSKLSVIDEVLDDTSKARGSSLDSTELVCEGITQLEVDSSSMLSSAPGTDFSTFFLDADNQVLVPFSTIFSHLVPLEVRNTAITNKRMYIYCQRVDVYKLRRREALTQIAAEASRVKKTEKKKKLKQANVKKESKKDGFARGGNS